MKTITTEDGQTVYDIAAQHYGNVEAVGEILSLNDGIMNDPKGYDIDTSEFNFDLPIKAGSLLHIDESSRLIKKNILREINETITTWQEL